MPDEVPSCEPWPITWPCEISDRDPAIVAVVEEAAQQILWAMTGRRFGICERTDEYRVPAWTPGPTDWLTAMSGWARRLWWWGSYYANRDLILLSRTPVVEVMSVSVDGVVLPAADYEVDGDGVRRLDQEWPMLCGSTVEITYTHGEPVPALGALAMGELGCELLAAFAGADCRLPSNVISINRQGVAYDLGAPDVMDRQGLLGLPMCDMLIRSTNPHRLARRPKVFSPDVSRRVR